MIDREARRQIERLQQQLDDLIHFRTFEVALPLEKQETKGSGGSLLLSFNEGLAAAVDPIIPCRLFDGILRNGKYDANLLIRDPSTQDWTLGDSIWAIDLKGSTSLDAETDYLVNPADNDQGNLSIEVGGDFIVALKDGFSHALTDTSYWAPTTDDPTAVTAWPAGTYPFGTLRTYSANTYIVTNTSGTSDTPGSSDWLLLTALTDEGAYDGQATYFAGNYVQEERVLYAIQSVSLPTTPVCLTDCDGNEICVTIPTAWITQGPCASGPIGPCPDNICVDFTGFTDITPFPFSSPTTLVKTDLAGCTYEWSGLGGKSISLIANDSGDPSLGYLLFGNGFGSGAKYTASANISGGVTWTLEFNQMTGITMPNTATTTPESCSAAPIVYFSSADICEDTTTLTIHGANFLPGATVAFTPTGTGTVSYISSNQLNITSISGLTVGALYAVVTTGAGNSGSPVQVATVEPVPVITPDSGDLSQNATTLTINGTGFIPGATNLELSSPAAGGYTWTNTTTVITVTFTVEPDLGALTATVTTACGDDTSVEVANVVTGGGGVTLVGHWPLNEGSGSVAHDTTVNANDIAIGTWDVDTPGPQAGSGGCVVLGTGVSSTATGLPYGSNDVSVSFWFKVLGDSVFAVYGAVSPVAAFFRTTTDTLTWGDGTHTINGASAPADGNWHLYTITWSGGNAWKYYEDGVLVNSGTAGFTINTSGPASAIVTLSHAGSDGQMKDPRIYSGVLTAGQVNDIFTGSPP